jgi:hypothetical protein
MAAFHPLLKFKLGHYQIFGTYWPVMRDAALRALCGLCLGGKTICPV